MSIQLYRDDVADAPEPNGSVAWRTEWMGGRTLALVRNCPLSDGSATPRTVYVAGEADTYFSQPARCRVAGRTVKGWLGFETGTGWTFNPARTA